MNAGRIPVQEVAALSSTCGTILYTEYVVVGCQECEENSCPGSGRSLLYVWYNIQYSICGVCQECEENSCPGSGRSLLYVWYNIQNM